MQYHFLIYIVEAMEVLTDHEFHDQIDGGQFIEGLTQICKKHNVLQEQDLADIVEKRKTWQREDSQLNGYCAFALHLQGGRVLHVLARAIPSPQDVIISTDAGKC